MTPTNQSAQPNLDARYRTMLTLWFALLMSIVLYFLVALFMARETGDASATPRNAPLIVSLTALGAGLVLLSVVVKQKLLKKSIEQQRVELVQQAMIVACALCEGSALLGLVARFTFDSQEYYLLFLISALGIAIHFPRRGQLLSATYKPS